MQLKKSSSAIHSCKVCFQPIYVSGLRSFIGKTPSICRRCYESFKPKFIRYKTLGYKCISLYFYDDKIRSTLFQFKGTLDYELKNVFISYAKPLLQHYFSGYLIIPAPSSDEVNASRGFQQVEEMFNLLHFPILKYLRKNCNHIQHEGNTKERAKVKNVIKWCGVDSLKGKRILFVDDVYTTGSTTKACLKLIEKHHPKTIKVLTMAKTREINDRDN